MRDGACSIGREGLATFGAVSLDVRLDEGHHHVVVPDNPRGGACRRCRRSDCRR